MWILRLSMYFFPGLFFLLFACQNNNLTSVVTQQAPAPAALPAPVERQVSYTQEVRPILEAKCLSCHSCYDAPCQLKMENAEGLQRGAFPKSIMKIFSAGLENR